MQIVINIDEKVYKAILDGWWPDKAISVKQLLERGTPLSKGHGRLIDEREVYKNFYCRCLAGVAKEVLDETPTIIEADKVRK